jgi:hypothetical protein
MKLNTPGLFSSARSLFGRDTTTNCYNTTTTTTNYNNNNYNTTTNVVAAASLAASASAPFSSRGIMTSSKVTSISSSNSPQARPSPTTPFSSFGSKATPTSSSPSTRSRLSPCPTPGPFSVFGKSAASLISTTPARSSPSPKGLDVGLSLRQGIYYLYLFVLFILG